MSSPAQTPLTNTDPPELLDLGETLDPGDPQPGATADVAGRIGEIAPVKYNAASPQLVPVILDEDGEPVEVMLKSAPLKDDLIRHYGRACEQMQGDEFDPAREQIGLIKASWRLFRNFIVGVEGVEGEPPEGWWDEKFGAQDRLNVINNLLLCEPLPPAQTKPRKMAQFQTGKGATPVRLHSYYNGAMVETLIVLKPADGEVYADYARGMRGGDSDWDKSEKLAGIGARLLARHENYEGSPPLHHMAFATRAHLERMTRVVRKN
jgi:hypothetical protein